MNYIRKKINVLSLSLLASIIMGSCGVSETSSDNQANRMQSLQAGMDDLDAGPIYVVAHRGCWTAAPENSLQAMENCIAMGVEVAEIDVRLTADGDLVVFHDRTVERMSNGEGYVHEKTLAELKELRLYERDGSPHQIMDRKLLTSYEIPTLRELLEVTRGRLLLNLEIKTSEAFGFEETFKTSVALARKMGVENEIMWKIPSASRPYNVEIVEGFSGSSDAATPADTIVNELDIKGLSYVTPIIWQSDRDFETQISDLEDNGIRSFEIVAKDIDFWPTSPGKRIAGADKFRYMGIAVLPRWSGGLSDDVALQNPDAAWGRLVELGVDAIMTDRPEQLMYYLKQKNLR